MHQWSTQFSRRQAEDTTRTKRGMHTNQTRSPDVRSSNTKCREGGTAITPTGERNRRQAERNMWSDTKYTFKPEATELCNLRLQHTTWIVSLVSLQVFTALNVHTAVFWVKEVGSGVSQEHAASIFMVIFTWTTEAAYIKHSQKPLPLRFTWFLQFPIQNPCSKY